MIAFRSSLNGAPVATAGVGRGLVNLKTVVRRMTAGSDFETLFSITGFDDDSDKELRWQEPRELQPGDELKIEVTETGGQGLPVFSLAAQESLLATDREVPPLVPPDVPIVALAVRVNGLLKVTAGLEYGVVCVGLHAVAMPIPEEAEEPSEVFLSLLVGGLDSASGRNFNWFRCDLAKGDWVTVSVVKTTEIDTVLERGCGQPEAVRQVEAGES